MTTRETNRVIQLAEQAQQIQEDTHLTVKSLDRFRKIAQKYWYVWLIIFGLVNGTAAIVAGFYHYDNKKNDKINSVNKADEKSNAILLRKFDSLLTENRIQRIRDTYEKKNEKTQDSMILNKRLDDFSSDIKEAVLHDIDGKFGVINSNISIMNSRMNSVEKIIKLTNGYNEVNKDGILYLKPAKDKK